MSVATEINRLNKAKSNLKTSINNKLNTKQPKITNETLSNYSAFVDSIVQGNTDVVVLNYYDDASTIKEKIKSLFLKEDGSISEHQLVKPSILLAPTIEPTDQTSTYTIGQYVCGFGDTESKIIEPTGKQITKYTLTFTSMAIDGGIYLTYNVSEDTLTYKWVKSPVIQSDYNQNDSTAKDYIKNRPCYEETFTLLDEKVSFKLDADGSAAHSDLLSDIPDLSKVSENTELTLLIDTNTFNLTYRGSSSEDLEFTSSLEESVMASLLVRTDFTGLELNLYGQKGSFSNSNATVKLSGSTVHRLDPKFIQSVSDIDITPYLSGRNGFIQGTIYTKPTIVLLKDDNYLTEGDITAYLVSEGKAPASDPR